MPSNSLKLGSAAVAALLLLGASACSFYRGKELPGEAALETGELTYAAVRARIFDPQCVSCHSGSARVSLDSYASIKSHLLDIARTALVERSMPPSQGLSAGDRAFLSAWIDAGAPEGEPAPEAVPERTPEPLRPTFESIKKHIFSPKCISCHSGDRPRGDLSLESLALIKRSARGPLEMEDEGDPDTSGLIVSLVRTDTKRMPPPRSQPALDESEIEVIREWIRLGTPE